MLPAPKIIVLSMLLLPEILPFSVKRIVPKLSDSHFWFLEQFRQVIKVSFFGGWIRFLFDF
jgi:hypothetical protein